MGKNRIAGLAVMAGLLAGLAFGIHRQAKGASGEQAPLGNGVAEVTLVDNQGTTALRTVAVVDTLTVANILTLPAVTLAQDNGAAGRQSVPVSIRFSNSGATVGITLASFAKVSGVEVLKDLSPAFTVTAGAVTDENSQYVAETVVFDGYGGRTVRPIVTTAPSAGTATIRAGSY